MSTGLRRVWSARAALVGLSILGLVTVVLIAGAAPPAPTGLQSSTHPDPNVYYVSTTASLTWDAVGPEPSVLDTAPSNSGGVRFFGDKAFSLGIDPQFEIYDVSDPSAVVTMGMAAVGSATNDLVTSGDYAYDAAGSRGVLVYKVDNLASPVFRRQVDTTGTGAWGIAVSGDTLYVADWEDVKVYDITNPELPVYVTTIDHASDFALDVEVAGDTLYVAAGDKGLSCYGVEDPDAPEYLGTSTPQWVGELDVEGDLVYGAGRLAANFAIFNVADPTNPTQVATVPVTRVVGDVCVWGDVAYLAFYRYEDQPAEIVALDVSDPTSPKTLRRWAQDYTAHAYGVESHGTQIGVGFTGSGFQMHQSAAAITPTPLGYRATTFAGSCVSVAGDVAFLGTADTTTGAQGSIETYDVSDPRSPGLTGQFSALDAVHDVAVDGDLLYAAVDHFGLEIVDASNPASLTSLGSCDTSWYANGVAVEGDVVYVSDYYGGMVAIDVSDSTAPTIIGSHDTTETHGIDVDGNIAVLANREDGIEILDVTSPSAPVQKGIFNPNPGTDTNEAVWDVDIEGDYVYAADDMYGVVVVDITDPMNPSHVATISTPGFARDVRADGNLLHVAGYNSGVTLVDITDPHTPIVVGTTGGAGDVVGIESCGEIVFAASNSYGGVDAKPGLHTFDCASMPSIYSYSVDTSPTGTPDTVADTIEPLAQVTAGYGDNYFHVRAIEHGVWSYSGAATRRVRVNTPPVANDDNYSVTTGTTLTVAAPGILDNDTDSEAQTLQVVGNDPATHGTVLVDSDGSFTYRPDAGFIGTDQFQYGISDGIDANSLATVYIDVTAPVVRTVTRVGGNARFDVAANLARKGWDPANTKAWTGVTHVIVANGEDGKEADPLCAAGLAGAYDAPVLLLQTAKIPTATKTVITEIAKKNPGVKVHIIGGTASVPDARWNEIRAIPGVSAVKDRIAGADRYAVSAAIATRLVSLKGSAAVPGVILVAGDNTAAFYDALAASPASFARTMPMLAVKKGSIPGSVASVLSGSLKGKPRYSASSATYIAGPAAGATRLTTSANRYTAASQIAGTTIAYGWVAATNTGLAAKLPDSLTGGAFLGNSGGVLLFTDSDSTMQAASSSFITARKLQIQNGWIFGGTASVPTAQETTYRNLLK